MRRSMLAGVLVGLYLLIRLIALVTTRPYEVKPPADDYCKDDETWFMTQYQVAPIVLPPCY